MLVIPTSFVIKGGQFFVSSGGYFVMSPDTSYATEDEKNVYGEYCYPLVGADPKTFVALSEFYGKDKSGVWLLGDPTPYGTLVPTKIAEADPATFELIADPHSDTGQPSEPYSGIYTKDENHVYSYGQPIYTADPNTFAVDNPPARSTNCLMDGHDRNISYFEGSPLPSEALFLSP